MPSKDWNCTVGQSPVSIVSEKKSRNESKGKSIC